MSELNIKHVISQLEGITKNQKILLNYLAEHPSGVLSRELASETAVSNKSATLTESVRKLLEDNGIRLDVRRSEDEGRQARWKLIPIVTQQESIALECESDSENIDIILPRAVAESLLSTLHVLYNALLHGLEHSI